MTGQEVERYEGELALPHSGELIDLTSPAQCADAYQAIQAMEARLAEAKRMLARAAAHHAGIEGTRTIRLTGGRVARVKGGPETVYDAEAIERGLRRAGMPEDRIAEIVTTEVTYKVKAMEAKRAAGANPKYARVIKRASTTIDRSPGIEIRKR